MRIALGVEYKGSRFHGWQKQQPGVLSVQKCLEDAISRVSDHTVTVACAGRTDAGVHATKQIVHFDTNVKRPLKAWIFGSNAHLPSDIGVKWSLAVEDEFHARFSASLRRYLYVIYPHKVRPTILHNMVTHEHRKLDIGRMHAAGQHLLGERDFTSFRSSICQSKTPIRNVHQLRVTENGHFIVIDISANAFLHHMVRNIAGVLMDIAAGLKDIAWAGELIELKNRDLASATAPPDGLYLVDVQYPSAFAIPADPEIPDFVTGIG